MLADANDAFPVSVQPWHVHNNEPHSITLSSYRSSSHSLPFDNLLSCVCHSLPISLVFSAINDIVSHQPSSRLRCPNRDPGSPPRQLVERCAQAASPALA